MARADPLTEPARRLTGPVEPPAGRGVPGWARVAAGVAGGLAEFATAPPLGLWPLGLLGAALLVLAARGARPRTALLAGYGYGLGLFVPLLTWLRPIGADAWLGLAGVQALWFAALAAAFTLTCRLRGWVAWTACLWVAEEWARDRVPFGGFTWGRLAFGQTHSPMTAYAALGGAPLLTFAVGLGGALIAAAILRRWRRPGWALAAAAGAAAITCAALAVPVGTAGQAGGGQPAEVTVAAVQGNVPRLGLPSVSQGAAVLLNHLRESRLLAREVAGGQLAQPRFVIWPEDSDAFDPGRYPAVAAALTRAVRTVGAPILVGAVLDGPGPDQLRNAGVVWTTHGAAGRYVKRHLVPFGEYIPFRSLIGGLIGQFSLIPENFVPGHRPGVLTMAGVRIGEVICFEVTFDGPVHDAVTHGGRLLVVQTNDATFEHPGEAWDTGESAQQLAIARLRAVEVGRSVVIASTSGVSAMISPAGRLIAHSRIFSPAVLEARLPLRTSLTLADRVGALPEYVLTAIGLAALGGALYLRRRRA